MRADVVAVLLCTHGRLAPVVQGSGLTTVHQSSSNPCADNTITISVTTNVPIYTTCQPKIVVSGLQSTCTNAISKKAGSSAALNIQDWTNHVLELGFDQNVQLVGGSASFQIIFDLKNPSKSQDAPGAKPCARFP